jgi:ribosomal protein S18 acetylase RimI-like enzyme
VLEVHTALPAELDAAGDLVADVYVAEGWSTHDDYTADLRDARGRAQAADVLVAALDGTIVGTATLARHGSPAAHLAEPGEAEIRMVATAASARGQGVGAALVEDCVRRAREAGCSAVRLSTQPPMLAAQRLYERIGFTRTTDRDWAPVPGMDLLTYWLPLVFCGQCGEPGTHERCQRMLELEPPRYCTQCRRRMVVQVHPTGWSARCVQHGTSTSEQTG